jgi:hypothetical protein
MRELFLKSLKRGEDAYLLFTGDLIHGPEIPEEIWPDYLGDFYWDHSPEVVDAFRALSNQYPHRVFCLLGNHEHSHIGGPATGKFHDNDVTSLEQILGTQKTKEMHMLFHNFPLVAVAPCGLVFTHAAPAAGSVTREALAAIRYEGYEHKSYESMAADKILGKLLWARMCSAEKAQDFLASFFPRNFGGVAAYGHDVVAEGYDKVGAEQLCFSTSFGLLNKNKVYPDLDLAAHYHSTSDLRDDIEIKKLYGS